MTVNPSWKLRKVFILIISQVIRIHFSKWEVVVVCRPRTPRGMRIFVLITIPIQLGKWEVTVVLVVVCRLRRGARIFVLIISQVVVVVCGPRRELKLLKDIDSTQTNYCILAMIPTHKPLVSRSGCGSINGPLIIHI